METCPSSPDIPRVLALVLVPGHEQTAWERAQRDSPPALSLIVSLLASTCTIALKEISTNRYYCHNKTHNIKHHACLQYCITYTLLGIEIIQDQCLNQVGHLSVIQQTVSTCQQYGRTYPLLWLPKQTPQISISISDPMMSPPTASFHSRSCIAVSKQNQKKQT